MGNKNEICIYFIGKDNGLFERIFGNIKEITHKSKKGEIRLFEGEYLKKNKLVKDKTTQTKETLKFYNRLDIPMKGFKYLELSKNNIADIFDCIKSNKNKKNIIIRFENTFIKEFNVLNNKLETDKPFILFCFSKQDDYKDDMFKDYKSPQYISYCISSEENESHKFYCKIISFILEKSSYYNEEGNKYAKYYPDNFLYKEPKGFLYLNILLTGESRAGKSSFINRIFNKLVSFESSKMESSTLKINSYEYYPPEEENEKDKVLKKGYGGIRIYDTPGLVKKKDLDSFGLIKSKLNKIFNKIHIILFFIKAQSNLEQCIDMLKFIHDLNSKREKKKLNKIPIIFVKNGEDLKKDGETPVVFQELKKQLQKYNLSCLYDNSVNQNIVKKEYNVDNLFDDDEDNNNNYNNYIDGNIIQIHIPTGKNMTKIFSTIKEYVTLNNNKLNDNILEETKKDVQKLIDFYILEKIEKKQLTNEKSEEYISLYTKCVDFVNKYKNSCSLLYNLEILNKKSKILYENEKNLLIFCTVIAMTIVLYPVALMIVFSNNNEINKIALLYGFGEKDLNDYGLDKYINNKRSEIKESIKEENNELLLKKELSELTQFFKDIMYYIGPIQCLIKSKEMFDQIINLLHSFSLKSEEDWNKFKIEKI